MPRPAAQLAPHTAFATTFQAADGSAARGSARRVRPPRPTVVRATPLAVATAAVLAASLAAARPACAQLLLPTVGGAGVTTSELSRMFRNSDDAAVVRPFADGFTFYGVRRRNVAVTTNGYLHFGGDASYVRSVDRTVNELAGDVGGPTAAVLYDDLLFDRQSSLLEHVAPGHYQAYTYGDVTSYGDGQAGSVGNRSTFQVAFFTGATRVGQVDFLPGDVAFSYGALGHTIYDGSATVGVARDADEYTALPGTAGGEIGTLGLLQGTSIAGGPAGPAVAGQRFVLLRPNAAGGYDVRGGGALITVPEPNSAALLAAGLGAGWAAWRRRRAS